MPFLILMIMVLPLSMVILGTSVGTPASIPPLVIAAFPFIARVVESSLREVDKGVIEAAQSMGCSPWQIIVKVMLPESLPSLISGGTIALTTILGYGAMAGIIGGGGLGKLAVDYGLYNFRPIVMWAAVIGLVILVQIFQSIGTKLSTACDKRLRNRS
jgi:D-methionine transport system permease protein